MWWNDLTMYFIPIKILNVPHITVCHLRKICSIGKFKMNCHFSLLVIKFIKPKCHVKKITGNYNFFHFRYLSWLSFNQLTWWRWASSIPLRLFILCMKSRHFIFHEVSLQMNFFPQYFERLKLWNLNLQIYLSKEMKKAIKTVNSGKPVKWVPIKQPINWIC